MKPLNFGPMLALSYTLASTKYQQTPHIHNAKVPSSLNTAHGQMFMQIQLGVPINLVIRFVSCVCIFEQVIQGY